MYFFCPFSILITLLGLEGAGLCAYRLFVSYAHVNRCHFFSSSWCRGLAAASACGSSWTFLFTFFSSPEPLGSQGELIVYPYSGVRCRRCRRCRCRRCRRRQQCLNIFSSETALPMKAKFYVESPWEGGTKVYINGLVHMTKMAAMPIYSKNLKKSSSPEPEVI